ncbi:SAV_2336 N-terminal domain-related protein [Micromonospora sp. NPDC002296]|uniref:SAV_2336 N-terminal domain-related protein n=1 Tax=Micromonospora sp. NPDC002296 TaxID=3154271 RepID=UPI0033246AFA
MSVSAGKVRSVFAAAGVELDARQLAEALWLAQHLSAGGAPASPPTPGPVPADPAAVEVDPAPRPAVRVEGPAGPPPAEVGEPAANAAQRPPPAAVVPAPAEAKVPVHLRPSSPSARPIRATPLLVHAAPVLPDTLRLARALRPLKRRASSRHREVVDEEATVRRIAERRIWLPVLRPAREPWLDLVLVADLGAGGQLWGRLAVELTALFRRLGAFRDIRLRHLHTDPAGVPWVTTHRQAGHGMLRSPAELVDPTGRRLILLLSDGVGESWQNGRLPAVLRRWARSGPVAVLQPLPAHLWERTALRPIPGRLRAPLPGVTNDRLSFISYRRRGRAGSAEHVPVPVLQADPEWLGPWAQLLSGSAHGGIDTSVLLAGPAPSIVPPTRRAPRDPVDRVRAFRAEATPEAYELVTYLSAAPLSLPLMRTVQAAMMPGSSPAHLAEILFSGLMRMVAEDPAADGDRFEFVDGVRDVLLGTLHRHEVERVDREVSAGIERRLKLPGAGLAAAVPAESGEVTLTADSQPFAHLRARILARMAGLSLVEAGRETPDAGGEGDDPPGGPLRLVDAASGTAEEKRRLWATSADLGWRAAARVSRPTVGPLTAAGLPSRDPAANLVPGSPADGGPPPVRRDPARLAEALTNYFRGWRRGRESLGSAVGDHPGEEPAEQPGQAVEPAALGVALHLAPALAEVLRNTGGQPVGTAFLVGNRYVVTCAHVVNQALEVPEKTGTWPDGLVRLRFHGGAGSLPVDATARVAAWPPHERTFDDLDVAVLRLEGGPPVVAPAPVEFDTAAGGEALSLSVTGATVLGGLAGENRLAVPFGSWLRGRHDISGAPVWRPASGQVVGMVNGRLGPQSSTSPGTTQLTLVPAKVIDRTIVDYLIVPRRRFPRSRLRRGYSPGQVDAFAERIEQTLREYASGAVPRSPVTAAGIRSAEFALRFNGYDEEPVDVWFDEMERRIADFEDE